jgi:hypothetical protein
MSANLIEHCCEMFEECTDEYPRRREDKISVNFRKYNGIPGDIRTRYRSAEENSSQIQRIILIYFKASLIIILF